MKGRHHHHRTIEVRTPHESNFNTTTCIILTGEFGRQRVFLPHKPFVGHKHMFRLHRDPRLSKRGVKGGVKRDVKRDVKRGVKAD